MLSFLNSGAVPQVLHQWGNQTGCGDGTCPADVKVDVAAGKIFAMIEGELSDSISAASGDSIARRQRREETIQGYLRSKNRSKYFLKPIHEDQLHRTT